MFNLKNIISNKNFLLLMITIMSSPVFADEVTDYINEGLSYYKKGQYTDAAASLNQAAQLIQQKKGGSLESLLPAPLSGWNAEDATSDTTGAAFGAGINAERIYHKNSGSITIQIVADSPMLQGIMMMLTNPMLAQADGGKLKRIANQKAVIKYDSANKIGDIQIVVANRFLVTINGDGVPSEDLMSYAKAIDYDKISALP